MARALWLPRPLIERCLQLCVLSIAYKRHRRDFCWCSAESFKYSCPAPTQVRSYKHNKAAYTAETMLTGTLQLNLCRWFPVWLQLLPGLFLSPSTIRRRGSQYCRELGLVIQVEVWAIFTTQMLGAVEDYEEKNYESWMCLTDEMCSFEHGKIVKQAVVYLWECLFPNTQVLYS